MVLGEIIDVITKNKLRGTHDYISHGRRPTSDKNFVKTPAVLSALTEIRLINRKLHSNGYLIPRNN